MELAELWGGRGHRKVVEQGVHVHKPQCLVTCYETWGGGGGSEEEEGKE